MTAASPPRPPGGAVAQATTAPAETSPDDPALEVCTALSLGWQTAELQLWRGPSGPDGPPELVDFMEDRRDQILWHQVHAHLFKLRGAIVRVGLKGFDESLTTINDSPSRDPWEERHKVDRLHEAVLRTLMAADLRLGKAYRVGHGIAVACRMPGDVDGLRASMSLPAMASIVSLLDDLSSALPPHTAHPVAVSLERWSRLLEQPSEPEAPELLGLLRRQGDLWRGLLSGDKPATDLLEIDNYLDAVNGLAAALDLASERGGAFSAQVLDRLAEPVWGAVLDQAVADAVTLLPDNSRDYRGRRATATRLALASPPYPPPAP